MPCNDCSRTESCPPCPYEKDEEPKGSTGSPAECRLFKASGWHCLTHPGPDHTDGKCCECGVTREQLANLKPQTVVVPQNAFHRCTCGHIKSVHVRDGGTFCAHCPCQIFLCDHTRCGWKPHEEEPEEPPLTPEEEEQAPEDEGCYIKLPPSEGPEYTPCACGHIEPEHSAVLFRHCLKCDCLRYRPEEPPPPQPERRPALAIAYSVQGHLYEVALSGDATVRAVDGALVITHALGPVAGIVQAAPLLSEEK